MLACAAVFEVGRPAVLRKSTPRPPQTIDGEGDRELAVGLHRDSERKWE